MMFLLGRQAMLWHEPPIYFALDQGDSLSLLSRRPSSDFRSRAAAEHYQFVRFRICLLRQLRRTEPFHTHLISPFRLLPPDIFQEQNQRSEIREHV